MLDDYTWSQVDDLVEEIKQHAVDEVELPPSVALIYHGGILSGILETPTFIEEDADAITDQLCRFLPTVDADQLLVVWPACFWDDDGFPMWAMKVHRWEKSRADRMVTRIVPVPLKGSPDGPSAEIDPPDPRSKRLAQALQDGPMLPGIMDTRFPPDFQFLFAKDGWLSKAEPLFLQN